MQANKLGYHHFIDTGRRRKTLGSETKNVINHGTVSISVSFPLPINLMGEAQRWAQVDSALRGFVSQLRDSELRKPPII